MSINLSDVAVKKFEAEAIQAFQEDGAGLRNTVKVRDAKGAKQVQFQVYGEVIANERTGVHTPIIAQDPSLTPATATVKNYTPSVLTDIFLNNQVGFDERQEAVSAIVSAMKRREDEIVLGALGAASGKTFTATGDNMIVENLSEAYRLLGSAVDKKDRHFINFSHFVVQDNVSSGDYNSYQALVTADVPAYMGFNIHVIGNRDNVTVGDNAGGLSKTGDNRTVHAWQKESIGLAINMQPKIMIDWEPSYGAHRITGYMSAGAVLIQDAGVVTGTISEA
jgi:hypothetical protein